MGRKTFESIGKPLPGRTNIVITRQTGLSLPDCVLVDSVPAAVTAAGEVNEIMIIGGGDIYRQALSQADRVQLTEVHATIDGDAFFPELNAKQWREIAREDYPADERHAHAYSFVTLERVSP
jgi:dihydrofolate reductase